MSLNYFPHSAAASRSPQLIRLRQKFGYEAIGMYWSFMERLAEAGNAIAAADLDAIAFDMHVQCTCNADALHMQCTLHALIFDFDLFEINGEIISSQLLSDCAAKRDEVVEKRKEAARKRWQSKSSENAENAENQAVTPPDEVDGNAHAMQMQCTCNAHALHVHDNKGNEIKGNEIKGNNNNNIIPPLSPKGGKKRAGKFDFEIEDPPEWIAADMVPAFKSWLEYKGSRGQGYANARTARICFDNLIKLSGGDPQRAMDIVNFSIGNNYAGLFPPEGKVGSGANAPNAVLKPMGGGAKW